MFYSKATRGFYDLAIHGDNIPADAVGITAADHLALLEGQSKGQQIVADATGKPILQSAPLPTHPELVAAALDETRIERQPIMGILDGMQVSALQKGDAAMAAMLETVKHSLRDLTKVDLSACVTADDMKAAVMARYKAISAGLPASVLTAFNSALS